MMRVSNILLATLVCELASLNAAGGGLGGQGFGPPGGGTVPSNQPHAVAPEGGAPVVAPPPPQPPPRAVAPEGGAPVVQPPSGEHVPHGGGFGPNAGGESWGGTTFPPNE